jgi:hypothetical protein
MENKLLKSALWYSEKKQYSVIPITPGGKKPLIKWEEFQSRKATQDEINSWWAKWPLANIGIVTGKLSNLAVIDLDKYAKDYDEAVSLQYFPDSLVTPCATTPRGGQHLYFNYPDQDITINARGLPGIDLRGEGGYIVAPPSVNGNGKPYAWQEGLGIHSVSLAILPAIYINKVQNIYRAVTHDSNTELHELQRVTFSLEEGRRNESLFHTAYSLIKGGMQRDNALHILESIAEKCCNPPMPKSEISTIIASAYDRSCGRERNIAQEIENWVIVTSGDFSVTDSYRELQIVTKEQKAAARTAFNRLQVKQIIEKSGNRDGFYRLRQESCKEIDWVNADTTPYEVKWPLGVHEYVQVYPKSIIIIAGESNAGKTAYCLNVARKNRLKREINYFLTEGDPAELKVRVEKFNEPAEAWYNVKFRTPRGNLSKVIKPDGFNIIDYLEIHKDFYEVSGIINEIYEKLTTGVAVIAMQKPAGRDLGIGGRGTLDKARLYLAIEPGRIKIVKGKIWRNEAINPDGLFLRWRLGGGCHFKEEGTWTK